MALTTAFLLYDGVAELDFAAPRQVFTASQFVGKTSDKCYITPSEYRQRFRSAANQEQRK